MVQERRAAAVSDALRAGLERRFRVVERLPSRMLPPWIERFDPTEPSDEKREAQVGRFEVWRCRGPRRWPQADGRTAKAWGRGARDGDGDGDGDGDATVSDSTDPGEAAAELARLGEGHVERGGRWVLLHPGGTEDDGGVRAEAGAAVAAAGGVLLEIEVDGGAEGGGLEGDAVLGPRSPVPSLVRWARRKEARGGWEAVERSGRLGVGEAAAFVQRTSVL